MRGNILSFVILTTEAQSIFSIFGGSSGRSLRGLRAGFSTVPVCGSVRRPATAIYHYLLRRYGTENTEKNQKLWALPAHTYSLRPPPTVIRPYGR